MEILSKEDIDLEKGESRSEGQLKANFKEILSAAFTDILEKKSSLFRSMIEKGVSIDFEKAFMLPKRNVSGNLSDLINDYKEDMK